jgi:dihydroorotate dehydrogenase (NAD+) catalytic subunit
VKLAVSIGSLTMKNPVTVGSGTFGFGSEVSELVDLTKFGAITVKATTRERRIGNPPTRIVETASGRLVFRTAGSMTTWRKKRRFCAASMCRLS